MAKFEDEVRARIRNLSNEALLQMAEQKSTDFEPFAWAAAEAEVARRGGKNAIHEAIRKEEATNKANAQKRISIPILSPAAKALLLFFNTAPLFTTFFVVYKGLPIGAWTFAIIPQIIWLILIDLAAWTWIRKRPKQLKIEADHIDVTLVSGKTLILSRPISLKETKYVLSSATGLEINGTDSDGATRTIKLRSDVIRDPAAIKSRLQTLTESAAGSPDDHLKNAQPSLELSAKSWICPRCLEMVTDRMNCVCGFETNEFEVRSYGSNQTSSDLYDNILFNLKSNEKERAAFLSAYLLKRFPDSKESALLKK